ncbi:hypothetical protein BEN47_11150 [Hymenobacter lapidarius]|uniref:Lipid A phosphate methyltransferase n=1 Tax=Hymenobacter lapidarius TaxID=1908237 RepID=A0A1G1T905_9BACT|nr:isoprenylcysteine carboxylmethyltransferase family protein [Hymenobacter lapidarius]OGX87358.1 hypothetical protein BEN47_11150 [Hymenobacter lapidarius]
MPLREEFERDGNWLFQRRSWLPLFLYPFVIAVIYFYPAIAYGPLTSPFWGLLSLAVSLTGLGVRALTVGFTPKGTSGRNTGQQVAETLNETGIYSVVRHPLYLGNFLMWMGIMMFPGVWWFATIGALAYWLYYERIMYAEEAFLRHTHAARYEAWASRTPAFLPRLGGWVPSRLSFCPRNVLKREYNGLFAAVTSFVLLNAIAHLFVDGRFAIDSFWQVVFAVNAVVFVVLRTLKKQTKILDTEGR